ncbi:MAG TPA: hypothetical protein VK698_01775 [Kofleriaceae bacterium]|nr:hypothetical protein [Kofleriaceae bacterium]
MFVAIAACSFPADYTGTRYQCEQAAEGECPAGYECVDGFCEASSATPDSGGGGGTLTDAGGIRPADASVEVADADPNDCESVTTLEERFESGDGWEITDDNAGCSILFESGLIELHNLSLPIDECAARSRDTYRLDARTWIQTVQAGAGIAAPGFGLQIGEQTFLFRRDEEGLAMVVRDGDAAEEKFGGTEFDTAEHRFWGFRLGQGDVVKMETSSDAESWVEQAEFRPTTDPRTSCIRYEISVAGGTTGPAILAFDNLNARPGQPSSSAAR